MRSLRRLELRSINFNVTAPSIIDAIRRLVIQNGALEHFALHLYFEREDECQENFSSLGQALCSVKSLQFEVRLISDLWALLPHLEGCESLELHFRCMNPNVGALGSIIACLPTIRRVRVIGPPAEVSASVQDAFLNMVRMSSSIIEATLEPVDNLRPSFQAEADSFCMLNKAFGTSLIGFGPTDLWTRVFSRIHDYEARATFLFRLLCEKPDLIVGRL